MVVAGCINHYILFYTAHDRDRRKSSKQCLCDASLFKVVKQLAGIGGFASAGGAVASVIAEMDHVESVVMQCARKQDAVSLPRSTTGVAAAVGCRQRHIGS